MKGPLIALILFLAPLAIATAQQQKIGHLDKQALLMLMPERPGVEAKLKAKAEELDARIKAMVAELEALIAKTEPAYATMTETEKAMAQRDVNQLQERIEGARSQANADLEALQNELMEPMLQRIDTAVHDVASENNFAYILDSRQPAILYFYKGEDIFGLVKAKLGIQ